MISSRQIRARALRLWDSGQVLRAWLGSEALFPATIPVGRPAAAHLLEAFPQVRAWKEDLEQHCLCHGESGYRIEYTQINHRRLGQQRLPKQVIFETLPELVAFIGKGWELARFAGFSRAIQTRQPALKAWLDAFPLKVLQYGDAWPQLLDVLDFFQANPHPARYLRELEIPAVDTKFMERRKGLIAELLDKVLPPAAMNTAVTGLARHGFERRYGLKYDESLIRFRLLDARLMEHFGGLDDITLPLSRFVTLDPPCRRVFITENKINGLSFPPAADSLVVFGLGYGIAALREADWLRSQMIHYRGDLDTHGFAMLSQLRGYFPRAGSFLMDRATLDHFREWCVQEEPAKRFTGELKNLDAAERALFELLRENRLGENIRLEQERIGFQHVQACVAGLCALRD